MVAYITELNSVNYGQFVSNELVLVFIFADWSGLSTVASPIVDEISNEYHDRIKIGKLNMEVFVPNIEFRDVPTFIIYKNGEFLDKFTGFESKEGLIEFFNTYL